MAIYKNNPPIITNGLILYLDAGSRQSYVSGSTTWRDLSGNLNSGSLTNTPTFNTSNQGILTFNGTNQYISLPDINAAEGINTLTVSIWKKRNTLSNPTAGMGLISKYGGTNSWLLYERNSITRTQFNIYVGGGTTAYSAYDDSQSYDLNWHNIVGIYDGAKVIMYKDGILQSNSTAITGNITNTATNVLIGTYQSTSDYFNGNIAQTQIYNRALSAQEVAQNYNALKSRFGLR
jgi:hypothetical protein